MSILDGICLAIFMFGFWQGWSRGIIHVLFNTIFYGFGVLMAFKMTPFMSGILGTLFNSQNPLMYLAGFMANMGVVIFLIRMASSNIENLLEFAYMGSVNKFFGGMVYGLFSVLVLSVLLRFAVATNSLNTTGSVTYAAVLKDLPSQAYDFAVKFKPYFKDVWDTTTSWMDQLQKHSVGRTESTPKIFDIDDEDKKKPASGIEIDGEPPPPKKKQAPPPGDSDGLEDEY